MVWFSSLTPCAAEANAGICAGLVPCFLCSSFFFFLGARPKAQQSTVADEWRRARAPVWRACPCACVTRALMLCGACTGGACASPKLFSAIPDVPAWEDACREFWPARPHAVPCAVG